MRRDRAHVGDCIGLYAQQHELLPRAIDRLKWYARQTQEARRIATGCEAFDEGLLHQVQIRSVVVMTIVLVIVGQMRRLPLGRASGHTTVVPWRNAVSIVLVVVIVSPVHVEPQ